MASSVSGSSNQSTTNAVTNQSTVNGYGSVTITSGNFYGLQSWGRVWIGGVNYDIAGPTSMSQGSSWNWSASRTFTHDVNGYRGDVGVSVEFWVDGTSYHAGSAGGGTQGAIDYDRRPAQPGSVSAVVNSDKSITVTVAGVSSPAGTPTYYCAYSQNGGGWTGTASSTSNVFTFSGLQRGATYSFLGYASNSDGTSASTASGSYFLPAGGKRWDGVVQQLLSIVRRWTGSGWVDATIARRWNGTTWQDLS